MIPLSVTLSYYKRKDIQEEMVLASKDREVAVRYDDKFGHRPDVLNNAADILELAKQKATSFHCSEELWRNPLQLGPTLKRHEMNELRTGWDLVLDIDCAIFEYSRITADLVVKALKFHNVSSISCKFSGNKGFHIGVPFEAFPKTINEEETRNLFPDAARKIAEYITKIIEPQLNKKIIEFEQGDISQIAEKTGKKISEITQHKFDTTGNKVLSLDVKPFLEIDTVLIASRHMFRMPYSLHEKSGLASVPINPDKIMNFEKEHAKPENLKVSEYRFLNKNVSNDARDLLVHALDFKPKEEEVKFESKKEFVALEDAVPEDLFPPGIKSGLAGLKDGKKRFLFALINFFVSSGWGYDEIEARLKEWNKKNP
ncbi:hypothetical protein ISS07_04285, partial [Candidatus Woesearchaeota archaeon]|nr:hypothetical protein [Candidatus Woesearchaeota archaeon]